MRDAEALRGEQEGTEREGVARVLVGEDLPGEVVGPRACGEGLGFHAEVLQVCGDAVVTAIVV